MTTINLTTSYSRQLLESQIKPGLLLNPITLKYTQLYLGIHSTQVDEQGNQKGVNGYEITTNFFLNGLWSEYPRTAASNTLLSALEDSTIFRSVNGYGVVVNQGTRFKAIDSRYYWELVDEKGEKIGSVVAYPYSSTNEAEFPNRIKVCISKDDNRQIEVREYTFEGITIGRLLSNTTERGDIIAWGNGISDYSNLEWLVNELNKRLDKNSVLLDRHSSPHLMGPPTAFQKRDPAGNTGQESDNSEFKFDEEGMYLPVDSQGGEYKYLVWEANAELNKFQLNRVLDLIHVKTGIPATAFGISSQTSGDSGLSLERQMFAALAKVRRWQRDIEAAVENINVTDLSWPKDPFASFSEVVNQQIQLVGAGIISADEARSTLGYAGTAPEQEDNNNDNTENMDEAS